MSDIAIRASATAAAPRDYTIPGAQEILPKAVTASFDGTGAASQWFPCLQVLDPGGNVMFSAIETSALSPGASADVSWFPGLGAGGSGASASGAWTQVFHFDVPALSSPTSIDTTGSTFSTNNNQIFGIFNGASQHGSSPDELTVQFNGDGLFHYTQGRVWGNANPSASPGTVTNNAGGLQAFASLGFIGAGGDSLTTTALLFVIPKVYQSTQTGKIIGFGGYTGISTGVQGLSASSYEFTEVHQLTFALNSGAAFAGGSSVTLWAV